MYKHKFTGCQSMEIVKNKSLTYIHISVLSRLKKGHT